ncbi:MAG: hypothetical protein QNJ31_08980 [Candidatus Caenarcaniphilales bacterium]|nr:hypothetical protein [Candidatus Caenarcaniphilales bacterium]
MRLFKVTFCLLALLFFNLCSIDVNAETSPFKLGTNSSSILNGTNINLVVEEEVDASLSQVGDLFVSRVVESAYNPENNALLIPRGSWVTGRVTDVQVPGRLSKAGKLSLKLDYLTTLMGEQYPLNAIISFERGKINVLGQLDPQTGFKDKALDPTKRLLASETGQIVSLATLGIPVVFTLIGGSAKAIVSKGDNIGLSKGEVFNIELKDDNLLIKE